MDYVYTADITPAEREIGVVVECTECDYEEYIDVIASIGHSTTTYEWSCPECDQHHFDTIYNEKLFDDD